MDPPAYLLGSDEVGRSQVVRLFYGGQVSLFVGFVAAFIQLTIGVLLGLMAGYFRGRVDDLITWFITTLNSIPTIFLLIIISALFAPGPITLTIIIGTIFWTGITNFVRGQTFALREREFVTAARTVGATSWRIMLRHILPNVLPLIFVLTAIVWFGFENRRFKGPPIGDMIAKRAAEIAAINRTAAPSDLMTRPFCPKRFAAASCRGKGLRHRRTPAAGRC